MKPHNDQERLEALKEYKVLDSLPEKDFDDITKLAACILDAPISLITFIDAERAWFKSKVGFDLAEAPRDVAFCSHTILSDSTLIVEDLSHDKRFQMNPIVEGSPHFRFYSGVPILAPGGQALGSLCVLDFKPRKLTDSQKFALEILGRQVAAQLELRKSLRNLEIEARIVKDQQAQIIASAKMTTLGEMAAGVAHEINNPLAILRGYIQILKRSVRRGDLDVHMLGETCEKLEETLVRISKIVSGLRTFARKGESDPFEVVRISKIVGETFEFCESKFRNCGVSVSVSEFDESLTIECRPVQISQVLLNLLSNSLDAVCGLPEPWVRVDIRVTGDGIVIAVEDSGQGIPEQIRDKIMQPFFTTKGVGKGTGLGLSLSRSLIESHQGNLALDLNSKNTRFVIRLPISQGARNSGAS